jgi:hypothetical protein
MNQDAQKLVCHKYNSSVVLVSPQMKIGLALNTLKNIPIYGVRLLPENDTEGWYIWGGEYSDDPDFFQPVHISHIEEILPLVIPYLALAPGYKFIIDQDGYEDVWFDETLLNGPHTKLQ